MNTVFARAVVALSLVVLPSTALASTKAVAKHHSVAKKDPTTTTKRKGKHHGHKATPTRGVASTPATSKDANPASAAAKDVPTSTSAH